MIFSIVFTSATLPFKTLSTKLLIFLSKLEDILGKRICNKLPFSILISPNNFK